MKLATSLIVGLSVAIILLSFTVAFINDWDFMGTTNNFLEMFFETGNQTGLKKVTKQEFISDMNIYWQNCDDNFNESLKRYVADVGNLNKSYIFSVLKDLKWCDSIQSATYGCGYREDIVMSNITLPQIVKAECRNSTLYIS